MNKLFPKLFPLFIAALGVCFGASAHAATMAIDSLSGPVTSNEIGSFKAYMLTQTPPPAPWGTAGGHNAMMDGTGGMQVEAMGMMYEVTNDIAILGRMIFFVDDFVATRNDLMSAANGGQRVMWDGNIDKVWCPNDPTSANAAYAGCEVNDTVAHIAYCAKLILQTPSIWSTTVPDGNPHGYGVTYLQRAQKYIAVCEETQDTYMLPYFVDPNTQRITAPTSSAWTSLNENTDAWNRQMMFMGGFQRLAECHEILGDNPAKVTQYDAIVQACITWFTSELQGYTTGGHSCYKWSYVPGDPTLHYLEEFQGIHAAYDILGIHRAYVSGKFGVARSTMVNFANTVAFVVWDGSSHFHGYVDGTDGTDTPRTYCSSEYIFLSDYLTNAYTIMANADLSKATTTADDDATILFEKNNRYLAFSVSATPASQTVKATLGTTYTVAVAPLGAFSGTVTLGVSGLPAGASFSFSPASITGALGSSTLTISTSSSTPAGNYTLTVTATSGSVSHTDTVTLAVTDFSVSASPSSRTVNAGSGTTYTETVSALNGFNSSVTLSASGLPTGASASFSPASVTGSGSSTVTVNTTTATPVGTNTVTLWGSSGSLSRSAAVTLIVNSPPLPTGWTDADVGTPSLAGSASYSAGVFTVNGSGADIYTAADQFNYAYKSVSADLTITARVAGQENTSVWAKAGVMIRESTAAGSSFVDVLVTPGNGVSMQLRSSTGASAVDLARITGPVAPYWVRLVRSGNTFTGYSSADGVSWTQVASTNVTMASSVKAGLAVCSHDNTQLNTSTFDNVSVAPVAFSDLDIGSPGLAGSGSFSTGVYTVKGSGADIYGTSDQFNFDSQADTGDLTITVRVASQASANAWSKSGVMVRETTAANSSYVGIYVTPGNGIDMQYRSSTGASAADLARLAGPVAPYWVRLVRSGNTFTGYSSADGLTWTQVGTINVTMASGVTVGLAVCSHSNTALNTSTFDNVSIQ